MNTVLKIIVGILLLVSLYLITIRFSSKRELTRIEQAIVTVGVITAIVTIARRRSNK